MNMCDGLTRYNFVIELDFTNLDCEQQLDDAMNVECELFEDVSIVLSRLVKKYTTLAGFTQRLESSTLPQGER